VELEHDLPDVRGHVLVAERLQVDRPGVSVGVALLYLEIEIPGSMF
jgi:hypothetical protein